MSDDLDRQRFDAAVLRVLKTPPKPRPKRERVKPEAARKIKKDRAPTRGVGAAISLRSSACLAETVKRPEGAA